MDLLGIFRRKEKTIEVEEPLVDLQPGRPLRGATAKGGIDSGFIARPPYAMYNPIELLETITTYNPDASLAVWNFLRLINPGYELQVWKSADRKEPDEESLALLTARTDDQFGYYGRDYGGGLSALIDVLVFTLLTQGAMAGELELSSDLKDVLDWCPVDPRLIGFERDEETGHFNTVASVGGTDFPLFPQQFRYLPLDPSTENPYGRGPMLPALDSVFFQTEVLRDLKAVAHISGHPRMHFKILEEIAEQHVPAHLNAPGREADLRAWMDSWLSDIAEAYRELQADDAFFSWDWIDVKAISAGQATYDLKSLIGVVEKQVTASLKHLPILLGRLDSTGLAHGSVQWQIFAAGILALRRKVRTLTSWWATQTLRVWGRSAVAYVEFPPIRTQDRLREAQAGLIEAKVSQIHYQMGWADNDELAIQHTGHKAVRAPIVLDGTGQPVKSEAMGEGKAKNGKGNNEGGASRVESVGERAYFDLLPPWMLVRLNTLESSVMVASAVRRDEVFAGLMAEGNGKGP